MLSSNWSIFKPIINQYLKDGSDRVFDSDHDNRKNITFSFTILAFLRHLNLEFCENIYCHVIGQF